MLCDEHHITLLTRTNSSLRLRHNICELNQHLPGPPMPYVSVFLIKKSQASRLAYQVN